MRAPFFARFLRRCQRLYWNLTGKLTVGVRLLAVEDGKVLLVRHTYLEGWFLPGGGVQAGESLQEAVRREAAEEAGAELRSLRLFGVYSSFFEGKSDHITVFLCEDFTWRKGSSSEIECVACFALEDLPEETSPGTRRRIAEYVAGGVAVAARW